MARFRKQDADAGVTETPMTADQKAEIAEVRKTYSAKLAQEEILYKTRLQARRSITTNGRRWKRTTAGTSSASTASATGRSKRSTRSPA